VRWRVKTANGTPLHVEVDGPLRPQVTVVFSHDWLTDLTTWRAQRDAIDDPAVRRVFYDHRGHGLSSWTPLNPGLSGLAQLAHDLNAVVTATAPSGPLILAGHSMGAMAVMAYAAMRPEVIRTRVAGMMFCAASPGPFRPPRGQRRQLRDVRERYQTSKTVAQAHLALMQAHNARLAVPSLRQTRVAVIAPERDRLVPFADQLELAHLIDGARLLSVSEAGHDVMADAPDLVTGELRALVSTATGPTMPAQSRRGAGLPRPLGR
jgi:pimeloyl-ACP methyl ester carboxylesterase